MTSPCVVIFVITIVESRHACLLQYLCTLKVVQTLPARDTHQREIKEFTGE